MKRLVGLAVAVCFVIGITTSHQLFSAPNGPPEKGKVLVCHVPEDDGDDQTVETPHVISVAKASLKGHLKHGDCTLTSGTVGQACDPTDEDDNDECDNAP